MRNTTLHLLNCYMLDNTYNHTVNFYNATNQLNWFLSKRVYMIENSRYSQRERDVMIDMPIHTLNQINYLLVKNENEQWLYYFVIDKIYVSDNVTNLILRLDVIQTYYFQLDFKENYSHIDRKHCPDYVNNSTPFLNYLITPEDIEIGEYEENKRTTIFNHSNSGGYIVTSTDKLSGKNGGSGGGSGSGGDWKNGILSSNGFRFIKGYEGYAPNEYKDSSGYLTICYGVTLHGEPDIYNELLAQKPVPEEVGAMTSYDLKNTRYGKQIVNACISYGVTKQNEFDALCSLAFNGGVGAVTNSSSSLAMAIKSGNYDNIRSAWEKYYITSDGVELEGLKLRRKAEANIFLDNNYEYRQIVTIDSNGNYDGYVTENNGNGWLPTDNNPQGNAIINSARLLIGKPYVFGGNYPPLGSDNGTDCSGLCQWAFNDNGLKISRTTYTQINEGVEINRNDIQIGDLVFSNFSSSSTPEHVFLYSGTIDGEMWCVEAPRTGLNIRERTFEFTSDMRIRRLL